MSDMYVYMYVCMYQELLKTTTNSSCVCTHLANKADSDSDSEYIHSRHGRRSDLNLQHLFYQPNMLEAHTHINLNK